MKRILVPACGLLLVVGALAPAPAYADSAPADPSDPRTPPTVTADALPTVQINGVVWDQEVVGNTVYAVGEFTSARPAGVAAGQQETPRANVLAYRLDTGELIKEFAPTANGVVKTVTASPDGKLLYLGGSFTEISGETRYRIAALNPTTGAVDPSFRPVPDSRVNAIVTDGKSVYFGGWFSAVGNQPRGGLAAVDARSGELRPWTPVADGPVDSMVISPDGGKVVVGGDFERLNNSSDPGMGMGAISTTDGSLRPWKVGSTVRNGVGDGGISALTTDGEYVYGTGWTWLRNSNFEGTFKASWADGSIEWLEDCHGDSYDVVPHSGVVYVANHAHNCESLGEFTDSRPRTFYRANAFSEEATGVLGSTRDEYFDFSGNPAPSMLNWFPDLEGGSYTGQYQAAWTAEAAGDYVVMGGEFPRVNGKGQQGLVRFSTRAKAPNAVGPRPGGTDMGLTASSHSGGTVSLAWTAASDQDNENLTYRIVRDGNTAQPVGEVKGRHRFYNRARMAYTDSTAQAGKQHTYQVVAVDPTGRTVASSPVQVTAAGGAAPTGYTRSVLQDAPTHYWRMGSLDAGLVDVAGGAGLTADGQVTGPVAGTVQGSDQATRFARTDTTKPAGSASTTQQELGPQSFTTETWIKTTTTAGGRILGFESEVVRGARSTDRHLWMGADGRLHAGVYPDRAVKASSDKAYNDGAWHHVAMSLGADGLALYVDGEKVAQNTEATSAQYYDGMWRLGGAVSATWTGAGATGEFTGDIDDTAVYGKALAADRIRAHYDAAGGGQSEAVPPTASIAHRTTGLTAAFDASGSKPGDAPLASWTWEFGDGQTGTGNTVTHDYAKAGTYTVKLTVRDADGRTGTATRSVAVTEPEQPAEPGMLVDDSFDRTGTGFGSPGEGMAWSPWSSKATMSTADGAGSIAWSAASASASARLNGLSAQDSDVRTAVRFADAPTGGGGYFSVQSRRSGSEFYAATLRARTGATSELSLTRSAGGKEDVLRSVPLTGLSVARDKELNVRLETVTVPAGAGTVLRAKVWATGTAEPQDWQVQVEDSTASLQREGVFQLGYYVSGSATNAPGTLSVNRFTARTTGSAAAN
ncbi:PKD domain-containing protein [Kocuria oceani]|uniref:PKD domain-containing protein n=2 Tax=Kocuria oceani TaxID=988827 RepID=A0ABV9TE42_9MICC